MIEESQKEHYLKWYRSLPANEIYKYRDRIIRACKLEPTRMGKFKVFENWFAPKPITPVPPLAQEKINEIAEKELDYTLYELPVSKQRMLSSP